MFYNSLINRKLYLKLKYCVTLFLYCYLIKFIYSCSLKVYIYLKQTNRQKIHSIKYLAGSSKTRMSDKHLI